ncbi:hypothetical protein [Roseivirga seohaensis]|uniref:hypothetical protein n=1 Tax=Roseivirga seohaensis TaxID=1914963 RepID=UPI003BAD4050
MKNWILILLLSFNLTSYTQESPQNLVDKVLTILKIEKEACLTDFIIEKPISDSESIILIPEVLENEEYISINAHVLIVNRTNAEIKSRFFEKESWYSDAIRLNKIEVLYQPYIISQNHETVGIVIDYYGSSRVNPYESTELSLFVRNGATLERVLKDFSISQLNGETDGMSSGEYIEHEKTIGPIINSLSKFYDLSITDTITTTVMQDGTEKSVKTVITTEILKYKNGEYKNSF